MNKTLSLGITAAAILLAGCGKSGSPSAPGDDVMRQKVVGIWKLDAGPTEKGVFTFKADGTLLAKLGPTGETRQMTWQVNNGLFVVSGSEPGGSAHRETNKIVRIDDHQWILLESPDGDSTNFVTFTKQ